MFIFEVLSVKINYFYHLEKFNVVNYYFLWVTNVKIIIFDVLWYQMYLFFTSKHQEYLSFAEPNVRNRYLWLPKLLNADYNDLSHRYDQKLLFLTSFFTKYLKWISLTILNFIYSYLCHSLIFCHLAKFTESNYSLTMKCYNHYDVKINYTLLFIFILLSFEKIMWTLEDIQGNHPDSGNSASVAWSYQKWP